MERRTLPEEASGCNHELANMRELLEMAERKQNQLQEAATRLRAQKFTDTTSEIMSSLTNVRLGSPSRSENGSGTFLMSDSPAVQGTGSVSRTGMLVRSPAPGQPMAAWVGGRTISSSPLPPGMPWTSIRARSPIQAAPAQATPASPAAAPYGYRVMPAPGVSTVPTPAMRVPIARQNSGSLSTPIRPVSPAGAQSGVAPRVRLSDEEPVVVAGLADAAGRSPSPMGSMGKAVPALQSPIKGMVDITQGKRCCARGRVYLYQAPFSPSVRYTNGGEYFVLPRGWAVMRSRQGLLVWLELVEDNLLQESVLELVAAASQASWPRPGPGAQRAASPFKRPGPLQLSLPSASGTVLGQLEIRSARGCPADLAIRVPCEDVIVLHPNSSLSQDAPDGNSGLRATLAAAPGTSSAPSTFDELFKAWLSSLESQV